MSNAQLIAIEKHLASALGTVRVMLAVPSQPVPEPPTDSEDPGQPENPGETGGGEQPSPGPTPIPTPPVTGGYAVFGPSELLAALKATKGGETIVAKGGYAYEGFTVSGVNPASEVRIVGEAGARFGQLTIDKSSRLRLTADFVLASQPTLTKATPYFVRAHASTSEIVIDGCRFRARSDADDYPTWDLATWKAWRMGAVLLEGADSAALACVGIGLNAGFAVDGVRSRLVGNTLRGASRDAYRLTADFCIADSNSVDDMIYLNDGNHPDMLQLFEAGDGRLSGLRIRDNQFRAQVNIKGNPLAATVQGIGGYGSPATGGGSVGTTFDDLVVENNLVEATAWNGMNLAIVQDGLVTRNRISDSLGRTDGHARLRITGACANTQVNDNSAPKLIIAPGAVQSGNKVG